MGDMDVDAANVGPLEGREWAGPLNDDFAGDGPLLGYVTNNAGALPDVHRKGGRYRAHLVDNTGNVTLHFDGGQGRLDAKEVAFPFEVIARNVGIGRADDSQRAPTPKGSTYTFAGLQVHVIELASANASHFVVGHRGDTHFTVEGKNTVDGVSKYNDDGANVLPAGRGDVRIVGMADRTLTAYWQPPNLDYRSRPDRWRLYRGTGAAPGVAPAFGPTVYVGLITYAWNARGLPFVGTCDAIQQR
ncbi:MAG: hypothetical protein AAF938_04750 [Myxococcota bacterium]